MESACLAITLYVIPVILLIPVLNANLTLAKTLQTVHVFQDITTIRMVAVYHVSTSYVKTAILMIPIPVLNANLTLEMTLQTVHVFQDITTRITPV
jgi:hypothetical protein